MEMIDIKKQSPDIFGNTMFPPVYAVSSGSR